MKRAAIITAVAAIAVLLSVNAHGIEQLASQPHGVGLLIGERALEAPHNYTVTPAPTAPKQADAAQPVNPPGALPPYDVDSDPTMFHHMRP